MGVCSAVPRDVRCDWPDPLLGREHGEHSVAMASSTHRPIVFIFLYLMLHKQTLSSINVTCLLDTNAQS